MINAITDFVLRWTWRAMGVLGLLVCIAALVGSRLIALMESDNLKQDVWYPSPDGQYVARYVSEAGGFALSWFCDESIFIYPAALAKGADAQEPEREIYRSSCQSVAIDDAHLQWKTADTLWIRVPIYNEHRAEAGALMVDVEFKVKG